MVRFFVSTEDLAGEEVFLFGENAQHAKVLRLKPGESVLLCDGGNRHKESDHRFCADPWHFNTIGDAVDKVVNIRGTEKIYDIL